MSLVDHLEELRARILKSGIAVVIGAIIAFVFWKTNSQLTGGSTANII